ncbi:hypothetical protein AURDEDRAFT_163729 [Auricularia subglabra TFB-10046 SS5]|nr:hypothetical protein AURDEDRAFT_163729 [Auricularia subglabra TFB-10046 SS5]
MSTAPRPLVFAAAAHVRHFGSQKLQSGLMLSLRDIYRSPKPYISNCPTSGAAPGDQINDDLPSELPEPSRPLMGSLMSRISWVGPGRGTTPKSSELEDALSAYTDRLPGSLLSISAINHILSLLLAGQDDFVPPPEHISLAAKILREQLLAHIRTLRPPLSPAFHRLSKATLYVLTALGSSAAVPNRWEHIHGILDLVRQGRFPRYITAPSDLFSQTLGLVSHKYNSPSKFAFSDACFRSTSHATAIVALSQDASLYKADWLGAVGTLARIRFEASKVMSSADFAQFLRLHEAKGFDVDAGLFISYIKGLAVTAAVLRRPEEQRALVEQHIQLKDVLCGIRNHLRGLERDILPRYPAWLPKTETPTRPPGVSRIAVYDALIRLYLLLPGTAADVWRCWTVLAPHQSSAVGILRAYPLDTVCELWELYLTSWRLPRHVDWAAFSYALRGGGAYAHEVRAIVDGIGGDLELCAVTESSAPSREALKRCMEVAVKHTSLPAERVRRILLCVRRAQGRVPFLIPRSMRGADGDTAMTFTL